MEFGKLIAPYARRISNMLARGCVTAVNGSGKLRLLQIGMFAGEKKDAVEHFEPYGFTSEVKPGSEPIAAFLDGDRSHGVVLVVADRRYRLTGMKSGEVAIYDDLGQKVHLTRAGIVIDGAGLPMTIENVESLTAKAKSGVKFETPSFAVTGNIIDNCEGSGRTMSEMRDIFNRHDHKETNTSGGSTLKPNQQM